MYVITLKEDYKQWKAGERIPTSTKIHCFNTKQILFSVETDDGITELIPEKFIAEFLETHVF